MGTSSCELLFITCACIQQKAGYGKRPILEPPPIFHKASRELLLESNEKLCLSGEFERYLTLAPSGKGFSEARESVTDEADGIVKDST
jgi:hypothetical protein